MVTRVLRYAMLSAIILGSLGVTAFAKTSIVASVDRNNVAAGDEIALTITVISDESDISDPTFTDMTPFDIYSSGRTQNIQWVNGKKSSSITYEYLMRARSEGEFTIGPASVKVGHSTYSTKPIKIKVTPGRTKQNNAPPANQPAPKQPVKTSSGDRRVFVTAELDRDTAYVNQAVTYIFRFYQGERLMQNPEYTKPSFPGFWVEDLPPQRKYSTVIEGVRYEVTEIRYALFATDAGPKHIGPARLKATVSAKTKRQTRQPFNIFNDDFFNMFDRGEILQLSTDPIDLTVLPLPEQDKPSTFSGLVGSFTLKAEADSTTVTVGDPLTVRLRIAGEGNIEGAPMPDFDTLPDMRTFSAGSKQDVSTEGYKISGSKTYEQVFVPQRPGTYRLPAFTLNYFDPNARQYKTLRTDSLEFTATGAAADFTIPSLRLNPDELSDLASDVRFIHTNSADLQRLHDPGLFGWPFWAGHIVPLLGLVGFIGWRRRTLKNAADPVGRRRRLAYRTALAQLQGHGTDTPAMTTEAIAAALARYYTDRFNRPAHGALRQEMREDLLRDGVDADAANEYLKLLEECDHSRYARAMSSGKIDDLANRARESLRRLEGVAK